MNKLYEALEICLQEIEQGADIDTVLFRYPDFADELRPILKASVDAKSMAGPAPSVEVVRRNRAKVLQHAAQVRESKIRSAQRVWFASLRRVTVTLAVVAALFVSGTNLVRAASATLPGDNLYPVKRTWEDVLLLFTFDLQEREALEIEHENERLHELRELFAEGRSEEIDFAGQVTSQNENEWVVSGIPVVISAQTEIRGQGIVIGSAVRVKGQTQGNIAVFAERIDLLPPGAKLPDLDDEPEFEEENHEDGKKQEQDNSGKGSEDEDPKIEGTKARNSESEPGAESFNGIVNSMTNDAWVVNGIDMDVSSAEIKGTPSVGASVKVEGYYDSQGVFIAIKIEFEDGESGNGSDSGSDDSSDDSGDNENDNSGGSDDDGGGNDNGGDSDGGEDHSGSGGGGGDD